MSDKSYHRNTFNMEVKIALNTDAYKTYNETRGLVNITVGH